MRCDVAVIGAGHSALVAAACLARAGLGVRVFERRPVIGGACVTEELWPGYRVSRAAYVVGRASRRACCTARCSRRPTSRASSG